MVVSAEVTQTNTENEVTFLNGLVVFQVFKCERGLDASEKNLIESKSDNVVAPLRIVNDSFTKNELQITSPLSSKSKNENIASGQSAASSEKGSQAESDYHYLEEEQIQELSDVPKKKRKPILKNIDTTKIEKFKKKKFGNFSFKSVWGKKNESGLKEKKKMVNLPTEDELNFFFRATNDELLYNLGISFYKDFKNGIKHFAFAHVNSPESQKRSILGVASLIKYFEDNKILIITSDMDNSFFAPFKKESTETIVEISTLPGFKYAIHQCYSLCYLEVEELARRSKKSKVNVLPTVIKRLMDDYDVVICDFPQIEERKDQYDIYLPLLQIIENVTFTISLKKSRFSEINELRNYFSSYKIKIKGSVVEKNSYQEGIR